MASANHVGIARGARCHNLLRQNIERRVGNDQAIKIAMADRSHQCRTFQQVVARGYK
jgi:hypothetical protein